ncbi:Periostin [Dirofilaria immitis]
MNTSFDDFAWNFFSLSFGFQIAIPVLKTGIQGCKVFIPVDQLCGTFPLIGIQSGEIRSQIWKDYSI